MILRKHEVLKTVGAALFLQLCFLIRHHNCLPHPGASLPDVEDDYLDALLQEFHNSRATPLSKPVASEMDNSIPLNNQSKYFKRDGCNCTKWHMCETERAKSAEESLESEEGADVDLINIRLNVPEGACPHYLDICCEKEKDSSPEAQIKSSIPEGPVCGQRNRNGVGFRIVGGNETEAQFGEFPWMAVIIELKPSKRAGGKPIKSFLCGASLIHPQVVLTAAHCLRNKVSSSLQIRVGEWDAQTVNELYPHEEVEVDQIVLHPDFVMKRNLINDIALLVLKREVQLAPNVGPICLPPFNANLDGARCLAAGWGKDVFGKEGVYQVILKKLELPIVPHQECQRKLRGTRLGQKFRLHESFVCAGGEEGKDTCQGDGGAPIVCQIPGSTLYMQYGITSWGIGCGTTVPGVYVNVPHFTPWIEETMSLLGLGMTE